MDTVLETHELTKAFRGRNAVDHVNIHLKKGEIYGLIGKNGAGKTTLMRMVLSLAKPTSGTIDLFGQPATNVSRARVGSLIEAPAIYHRCTAQENLRRFAALYGADQSQIPDLLRQVGLADTGSKKAGAFSLGMKQRLGIAIAMLGDPDLMILDEPVNGLDPEGMRDVRDLIHTMNREKGTTFLISSHLLDELQKTVTRYGILNSGHLVEELSADELRDRCRTGVVFTVDDTEKAAAVLKEAGETDMICGTRTVTLLSHLTRAGEFNRLLVHAGVTVSGIENTIEGQEDYFVRRMGE